MGIYMGDQNQYGFFYESGTYANPSGALQWIGLATDHNLEENPNRTPIRYAGTATRNVDKFVDTQTDVTGTISYQPQDWKFLMFALGSIVDGGSPSPYLHEIKEVNGDEGNQFTSGTKNPFISFAIEDSKGDSATGKNFVRTVNGCTVDSYSLNWSQGDIVNAEVGYIAQNVSDFASGAASALTEVTTQPFVHSNVSFHLPSGTKYDTNEGTFEINNNLNARHYTNGSLTVAVIKPESRDYNLEVSMDMVSTEAKTLYEQYFKGGSVFNSLLVVDSSTGSRDMIATLSGCKIVDMTVPSPIEGVNEYTIVVQPKACNVIVNDAIGSYAPFG